jgi:hypothetical protein
MRSDRDRGGEVGARSAGELRHREHRTDATLSLGAVADGTARVVDRVARGRIAGEGRVVTVQDEVGRIEIDARAVPTGEALGSPVPLDRGSGAIVAARRPVAVLDRRARIVPAAGVGIGDVGTPSVAVGTPAVRVAVATAPGVLVGCGPTLSFSLLSLSPHAATSPSSSGGVTWVG